MIKIWTILKSRFISDKNEDWVIKRREICKNCRTYNSLHYPDKVSFKNKVYKILSDFYTFITFAENEDLGQCLHPECGCDIYQKSKMESEFCQEEKWKSIYIPNK
jgi:hypothetical protein